MMSHHLFYNMDLVDVQDQMDIFPIVNWQSLWINVCLVLVALCPFAVYGNSPVLLQHHDENVVCAILIEEIPDLTIDTLAFITAGWGNLVADINSEWIFRFPRVEEFLQTFEREQVLLERLQNKVSILVPHYQYIGSNAAFRVGSDTSLRIAYALEVRIARS